MDKGIKKLCIVLAALIILIAALLVVRQFVNHPDSIEVGDNKFDLGPYDLQEEGLARMNDIIAITEGLSSFFDVGYFEAEVDENCMVKSFTLSLNTFDSDGNYRGIAGYTYDAESKALFYSPAKTDGYTNRMNQNSTLAYLDEQIKKVPLKEQIAIGELDAYHIEYREYALIDKGTPIFDGREDKPFPVLSKAAYNLGKGGVSDGKTSVVFDLYNGDHKSQHYLYVCPPVDQKTAIGNLERFMAGDYYINNGVLKITRDHGQSWIEADISAQELNETFAFQGISGSFAPESIFISPDKGLPIAFFYGKKSKLKILPPGSKTWKSVAIPTRDDFGRSITKRVIGFVSPSFGYAAMGTDWSMGAGESKKCYLTFDGGDTWIKKSLPMECMNNTLIDFCMIDEEIGALTLNDGINADFPFVFFTDDGAEGWMQVELPFKDLPEGYFLMDIIKFKHTKGKFVLTLGQENDGVKKAVFVSDNLTKGWKLSKTYESVIHTVG